MTTDLMMLTWSAALCALLWVPYILARIGAWGLVNTVSYPESPPEVPAWSARTHKAHLNLVENLVPFAALVLVAHAGGMANEATALGATIFFWSRVAHAVVYIFAIPWVRTLAFVGGFVGMVMIFLEIIGL
ncbi:MAG: MAPEG family protein [Alphaproteobacteria bacterium]|nr:MAPEG family protein [Alphaproteobacteria bacterium]